MPGQENNGNRYVFVKVLTFFTFYSNVSVYGFYI